VKPNVNTLNKDMESNSSQSDSSKTPQSSQNEASSDKEKVKEEVSDSFKKEAEDTLGEFDLKDFDFDGMNNDTLQDLMDAVGDDLTENFIEWRVTLSLRSWASLTETDLQLLRVLRQPQLQAQALPEVLPLGEHLLLVHKPPMQLRH